MPYLIYADTGNSASIDPNHLWTVHGKWHLYWWWISIVLCATLTTKLYFTQFTSLNKGIFQISLGMTANVGNCVLSLRWTSSNHSSLSSNNITTFSFHYPDFIHKSIYASSKKEQNKTTTVILKSGSVHKWTLRRRL